MPLVGIGLRRYIDFLILLTLTPLDADRAVECFYYST